MLVAGHLAADRQKSSVFPSGRSTSLSMRSGQSVAAMSQNRQSRALGTRVAGLSAASLRHQCYEVLLELVVYGLGRDADRTRAIASYR